MSDGIKTLVHRAAVSRGRFEYLGVDGLDTITPEGESGVDVLFRRIREILKVEVQREDLIAEGGEVVALIDGLRFCLAWDGLHLIRNCIKCGDPVRHHIPQANGLAVLGMSLDQSPLHDKCVDDDRGSKLLDAIREVILDEVAHVDLSEGS